MPISSVNQTSREQFLAVRRYNSARSDFEAFGPVIAEDPTARYSTEFATAAQLLWERTVNLYFEAYKSDAVNVAVSDFTKRFPHDRALLDQFTSHCEQITSPYEQMKLLTLFSPTFVKASDDAHSDLIRDREIQPYLDFLDEHVTFVADKHTAYTSASRRAMQLRVADRGALP